MEIKNIILGHINELFNINNTISQNRLNICYRCPLYSKRLGGMCNNRLWININTGDVSSTMKHGYVNGCGCRLIPKTRLASAKCPINKW